MSEREPLTDRQLIDDMQDRVEVIAAEYRAVIDTKQELAAVGMKQQRTIAQLQQTVAAREEAILLWERKCNDRSQALEQLQQTVAAREEAIMLSWQRKCTDLERSAAAMEADYLVCIRKEEAQRKTDIDGWRCKYQHQLNVVATLEAKVRTQKAEISELHRVRSELEFNQNIKTADRTDLQADNDRLLKAEQEYMAEVAELKQTLANTQARDAGITRGLHAKINSLELDIATLQTRMRDRDRVIKRLTNSLIKLDHEELVKEAYNTAEDPSAVPPCWASTAQTQKWQEQRFAMFSRALANMLSDNDAEDYVDDAVALALKATEKGMKAIYANASPTDDVGDL